MTRPVSDVSQIVAFWQTQYPPFRYTRICGIKNSILNVRLLRRLSSSSSTEISKHVPLTKSQLARIHQPVLILHVCVLRSNGYRSADQLKGENNPEYPLKYAEQLREGLVNSEVMLSVIKGTLVFVMASDYPKTSVQVPQGSWA